jgi:colicin import membrane protein
MSTLARPVTYGPSSAVEPGQDRRFGPAFWASAIAHGAALAALLFFTLALRDKIDSDPPIFEVVAGEGNAFDAKEAPAGHEAGLAAEGPVEFTSPTPAPNWTPPAPAPMEAVTPPEAPPTPAAPVPPVTKVEPVKPAPKADPIPNLKNAVLKNIRKEEKKVDKQIQAQRAADAKAAAAEAKRAATSYAEFQKQQGSKSSKSATSAASSGGGTTPGPRVDASGIRKGVTGANGANREGAGGKALTADGGASLDRYFSMLIERLRSSHEKPGGLSDLLSAEVEFTVAANGAITGVRITRSSGNNDFDQSVLETFARVRSVGPRPDGKTDVRSLTFRMKEV